MFKIAVFVSGQGSNLKALLETTNSSNIAFKMVVSDKLDCPAFDIVKGKDIPCYSVSKNTLPNFILYKELIQLLEEAKVNLIVLAGFLKKIPDELIEKFENKIINVHPALLPAFGGKGMYGMNVHNAVFESSAQVSGATVHFVDKIYDNGFIIAQKCVDISNVSTPEEIARKVLTEEHKLLPFVVKKFAENKIKIQNKRVLVIE